MTLRVKVRQGGGAASATTDFSDMIPLWYGYEFSAGMQFGQGSANQSQFTIVDIDNLIRTTGSYQVNAHNVVWITEDGPGSEVWLHRGRVARKDFGRGIYRADVARTVTVTSEDGNVDLRGLALVEPWPRPEETATERAIATIEAFCQGSPRLTTDITAVRWDDAIDPHLVKPHPDGEVTMPAETYEAGTEIPDILRDCAATEGQEWGVVIHHDGGSHLCFMWTEEDDWDTYPCTLSISDNDAEVNNTTVFAPHWKQGAALQEDGQEVVSGLVSRYGVEGDTGAYTVATDPALVEVNDYWVTAYDDGRAGSDSHAINRAPVLLLGHSNEHRTTQVSLLIPATMVDLLCAGMSITIKAAASRAEEALHASITRRIASLKWEPKSPEGDTVERLYWAHMQLDRPKKIARDRRGTRRTPQPPTPGTPNDPATTDAHWGFEGTDLDDTGAYQAIGYGNITGGAAVNQTLTTTAIALTTPFFPLLSGTEYTITADVANDDTAEEFGQQNLNYAIYETQEGVGLITNGSAPGTIAGGTRGTLSATFTAPANPGGGGTVYLYWDSKKNSTGVGNRQSLYDLAVSHGGGTGGTSGDGHPDLVGTDPNTYAQVDHDHIITSTRVPVATDDASEGIREDTIWIQVDDEANPTTILAAWVLLQDTTGAAVWAPWPGAATSSTALTVEEEDGSPAVEADTLKFPDGSLTDNGDGSASVAFPLVGHVHNAGEEGAAIDGAYLSHTGSATNIPDSTITALPLSTEVFDTNTYWDSGSPTRITIPEDGWYEFWGETRIEGEASFAEGSFRLIRFRIDGGTGSADFFGDGWTRGINALTQGLHAHGFVYLTAGQYVELTVQHNAGETLRAPWDGTTGTPANYTRLLVKRVSGGGGGAANVVRHPVMAQDPSDGKWYVVVSAGGTAVMAEAP